MIITSAMPRDLRRRLPSADHVNPSHPAVAYQPDPRWYL